MIDSIKTEYGDVIAEILAKPGRSRRYPMDLKRKVVESISTTDDLKTWAAELKLPNHTIQGWQRIYQNPSRKGRGKGGRPRKNKTKSQTSGFTPLSITTTPKTSQSTPTELAIEWPNGLKLTLRGG